MVWRDDRKLTSGLSVLLTFLGIMWLVMVVFSVTGQSGGAWGIIPRSTHGLTGILSAPFVHGSVQHLISNTIPLLCLGLLILLRGTGELVSVTQIVILVSGAGIWLFGFSGSHIGASGVVFGYFGFLVFRSYYDRSISSILITLLVFVSYGAGMLLSLLPSQGVSWSGHFFGFVAGFLAARHRYGGSSPRRRLRLA